MAWLREEEIEEEAAMLDRVEELKGGVAHYVAAGKNFAARQSYLQRL